MRYPGDARDRAVPPSRRSLLVLAAMSLAAVVGCGGGRVPVAGRVVFDDGEPVRTGRVELRGRDQRVRAAGMLDSEGRFRLVTDDGRDGLPPGEYDAIVVQIVIVEHRSLEEHGHGRPLSRRFADYFTSGLTVSVPDQGTADLEIVVDQNP